ncbi:MAG TPA: protease HtpX [Solibacterales bacterium]|jgi:heat shock protein HtpX|nr:protease HtpX [Bryobacterales bacterium]
MHSHNGIKTVLLLGALSAIFLVAGSAIAGRQGLIYGLGFAVLTNVFSYFFSDKLALSMSGAQPLTEAENPEIYRRVAPLVRNLCNRMQLPLPKLYITPEESPNAFATGRDPNHSSLAFTAGILQVMNNSELEGVVAHELGHVLHRDILISSVAATVAAAITALARMAFWFGGRRDDEEEGGGVGAIAMMILAPIAALLIQMAISRTREYDADAASAKYTGNPQELISALTKLESWSQRIPMDVNPATSHLYIIKPFTGQSLMRMFSTHPSTADRIARLESMRG